MSFSEDEEHSNYKIDENEEDPLSAGIHEDNINNWDFDADGDKVDIEGKFLLRIKNIKLKNECLYLKDTELITSFLALAIIKGNKMLFDY
ncbi:hypothetical protein OFS02_14405 [Brachyspira hyodysenteriae]|uniref:hypothetical protein n=1 Tax=Brachyspira hyodysenteriae TaxID=159 RepID=UPI0022CDC372|nr:hypothetical protein [Brachyspira hyodysenteriae]MDA0093438.1 hypothetical protein [Brachyspira hyodysenteriae]